MNRIGECWTTAAGSHGIVEIPEPSAIGILLLGGLAILSGSNCNVTQRNCQSPVCNV